MKKILSFLLLALLIFSVTACGEAAESSKPSSLNNLKEKFSYSSK